MSKLLLIFLFISSFSLLSACNATGGYTRCGNSVCYQKEDDSDLSDEDKEFQARFANDEEFEKKFKNDAEFESSFADDDEFEEKHRLLVEKAEESQSKDEEASSDDD